VRIPAPVRRVLVIAVHATLAALAYYLAFVLRLDDWRLKQGPADYVDNFLRTLPALLVLRLAALQAFGLNRGLWRYAGLSDLVRLALAVLASGAAFFAAATAFFGWKHVPHSVHVIDATLAMLLLGGVRFVKRLVGERLRAAEIGGMRSVIVGAGDAGEAVLREMQRTGRESPVAFVDDDPALAGRSIHGVRVMGTVSELGAVVRETGAGEVVVAVPARTAEVVERAVAAADGTGARFRVIPETGGAVRLATLKHLDMADLLARPVAHLDEARIRGDIAGRRVLVTGGAGSIGSELVRQCLAKDAEQRLQSARRSPARSPTSRTPPTCGARWRPLARTSSSTRPPTSTSCSWRPIPARRCSTTWPRRASCSARPTASGRASSSWSRATRRSGRRA
jgi:FlaA1/EpsC-like NDP-sugar epimerase